MNEEKIKEIANLIQELVKQEVETQCSDRVYKDELRSFIDNFDYYLHEARETLEDFRSQGLSLNTIESEGYLRAFLTIESIIPTID